MLSLVRTRLVALVVAALVVGAGVAAALPATGASAAAHQKTGCGRLATSGTTARHLTVDGVDRQYLLSIPDGYDGSHAAPLVLDFHGLGSNMQEQSVYSQLSAQGGTRGYVVITPDGQGDVLRRWSIDPNAAANPDVQFVKAMLADTQRALCIDPRRVYATGISNGAIFSTVLACALPGRFAAIAPVAGVNGAPACRSGTPRVNVLAFHGTGDPIVPFDGGDYFSGVDATHNSKAQAQPVDDAVAAWAAFDGCGSPATEESVAQDVQHVTYPRCPQNGDVELYRVIGGGHTWPGAVAVRLQRLGSTTSSIDATKLMLAFFDARPRTN
jgi:polyhydroxybutyrate depolymerase